jgi:hypothetical protein
MVIGINHSSKELGQYLCDQLMQERVLLSTPWYVRLLLGQ